MIQTLTRPCSSSRDGKQFALESTAKKGLLWGESLNERVGPMFQQPDFRARYGQFAVAASDGGTQQRNHNIPALSATSEVIDESPPVASF